MKIKKKKKVKRIKISKRDKKYLLNTAMHISWHKYDLREKDWATVFPRALGTLKRELLALKKWNGEEAKPVT